jgi:AmiR/NasT family two-component response regulator
MVLQPPQARVRSCPQNREASSRATQFEADVAQLKEALRQRQWIRLVTGLVAQRSAITPDRAWTLAADNADDEASCLSNSRLRIVQGQP